MFETEVFKLKLKLKKVQREFQKILDKELKYKNSIQGIFENNECIVTEECFEEQKYTVLNYQVANIESCIGTFTIYAN